MSSSVSSLNSPWNCRHGSLYYSDTSHHFAHPCGSLKRFLLQSTALPETPCKARKAGTAKAVIRLGDALRLKDLLKVFGHRLQGLRPRKVKPELLDLPLCV